MAGPVVLVPPYRCASVPELHRIPSSGNPRYGPPTSTTYTIWCFPGCKAVFVSEHVAGRGRPWQAIQSQGCSGEKEACHSFALAAAPYLPIRDEDHCDEALAERFQINPGLFFQALPGGGEDL
jgi:hypothetical protein